ncbi:MAG: hypothetical protein ACI4N4_06535 [Candidatus Fimenecus sp.]
MFNEEEKNNFAEQNAGEPQQVPYSGVQQNGFANNQNGQYRPYGSYPAGAPVNPQQNMYGQGNQYGGTPQGYYSQTPYPYMPGQLPERKKGKTAAIIIGCIAGVVVLIFAALFVIGLLNSPEKRLEKYEESGELADLIYVCDAYDTLMPDIDNPVEAEKHFETALSDTKEFLRTFKNSKCAYSYADNETAYQMFVTDWFCLLLINENYDKYSEVFLEKMLERSPSGYYYMDTYILMHYIDNEYIEFNEAQKKAILSAFDALIVASDEKDKQLHLAEYYDFCECIEEYEKADEIEKKIAEYEKSQTLHNNTMQNLSDVA